MAEFLTRRPDFHTRDVHMGFFVVVEQSEAWERIFLIVFRVFAVS
jgi:hypothetical protein